MHEAAAAVFLGIFYASHQSHHSPVYGVLHTEGRYIAGYSHVTPRYLENTELAAYIFVNSFYSNTSPFSHPPSFRFCPTCNHKSLLSELGSKLDEL